MYHLLFCCFICFYISHLLSCCTKFLLINHWNWIELKYNSSPQTFTKNSVKYQWTVYLVVLILRTYSFGLDNPLLAKQVGWEAGLSMTLKNDSKIGYQGFLWAHLMPSKRQNSIFAIFRHSHAHTPAEFYQAMQVDQRGLFWPQTIYHHENGYQAIP